MNIMSNVYFTKVLFWSLMVVHQLAQNLLWVHAFFKANSNVLIYLLEFKFWVNLKYFEYTWKIEHTQSTFCASRYENQTFVAYRVILKTRPFDQLSKLRIL